MLLLSSYILLAIFLVTRVWPSESQTCASMMGDGYVGAAFPTCTRCPEGMYAVAGDNACTPCPDNSFSVSGSGSCQCKNGYGQSGIDKTLSCTLCSSSQVFYSNTCPSGYTYYASTRSCYKSSTLIVGAGVTMNWYDAKTACNNDGRGYLATINSQTENNIILSFRGSSDLWIGTNDQIVLFVFVWSHGTSLFSSWISGEPNNYNGNERCAQLVWNGLWNDMPCSNSYAFVCEANPITSCSSSSSFSPYTTASMSACSDMPPVINSLIGYYNAKSWDGSNWNDLSGSNNHVTSNLITGIVTVQNFDTISGLDALTGTTTTTITWPNAILPATYTLFHLSKYNGVNKQRLIAGISSSNWLSGHYGWRAGLAHHNGWNTIYPPTYGNVDDWLLSSDQNALYRAQGVDLTIGSPGSPSYSAPMAINKFYAEVSDWAVATVLVYSRTLTGDEIEQVERWLYSIYFNRSSISSFSTKAYRLFPNCFVPPPLAAYSSNIAYTDVISTIGGLSTSSGSADGIASRFAPFSTSAGSLVAPTGLALDSYGNAYICDADSNKIRRIAASNNIISTIAGTGAASFADGTYGSSILNVPWDVLLLDDNTLFFSDRGNHRIRKIDISSNTVSTVAGTGSTAYNSAWDSYPVAALATTFDNPCGIAASSDKTRVYIADIYHHRIRVLDLATNMVYLLAGTGSVSPYNDHVSPILANINLPAAVAVDLNRNENTVYFSEWSTGRIRRISYPAYYTFITIVSATHGLNCNSNLFGNRNAYFSSVCNNLYECAFTYNMGPSGGDPAYGCAKTLMITYKCGESSNIYNYNLAAESDGQYVNFNCYSRSFSGSILSTIAGTGTTGYSGDGGLAILASIGEVMDMVVDEQSNIYLTDYSNHVIRKISTADGKVSTIAGQAGISDSTGDGYAASSARITRPRGIHIDTIANMIYFSDRETIVRKITLGGHVEYIEPILSYRITNGGIGSYTYTDGNYNADGLTTTAGSALSGGVGLLSDGTIATCDWQVCSNTNPAGKGPYINWFNGVFYQTYYFSNYGQGVGGGAVIHRIEYYFNHQSYGGLSLPTLFTVDGIYRAYTVDVLIAPTTTASLSRVTIAGLKITGSAHKIGFTTVASSSIFISEVIFYSYTTPQVVSNANFQLDYTATYTSPAISVNSWSSGIVSAYKDTTYGGLPTYPGALNSYNYGDFYVNIVGANSILTQTIIVEENSYITITFAARYQPNVAYKNNPPEASRSYSSYWSNDPIYLYSMLDSSSGYGCWAAGTYDINQYMTIDLGSLQHVAGVVTQARCTYLCPIHWSHIAGMCYQYVTTYNVGYSTDGSTFTLVSTAASSQTFYGPQSAPLQASCDKDEKVYQYFMSTISARYIRFYPQTWNNHISMRAGIIPLGLAVSLGGTVIKSISPLTSTFKVYYSNSIAFTTSNIAGTKVSKVLQFKTLASACSGSTCNAQVDMVSFASYSLAGWTKVLSKGAFGAVDLTEAVINSNFAASSPQIFVRSCPSCAITHKIIYYRRLTAIPASPFSIYKQMSSQWTSSNNILGTHFGLYYTLDDALKDINRWTFCDYDDNRGVGFPRNGGPTVSIGVQWNSFGCGTASCDHANQGQADVAFYILNPEANALCGFKQGISNWPGSSGGAITGWDCVLGDTVVATSFPCSGATSSWTGVTCSSSGLVTGLSLTSRGLVGTISSSIGNLIGLTSLDLSTNSIFGSLPQQLSALNKLTTLFLNSNSLSQNIPSQLSSLSLLTSLYLNLNRFSNFIPTQISALTRLTALYLNDNRLEGPAGSFLCISSMPIYINFDLDSKFNYLGVYGMNGASITIDKQVGTGSLLLNAANSQYVQITTPFTTGTSGMSFSFWFRSSNTGHWGRIFDFGNGPNDDNILFGVYNNYVAWGVAIGNSGYYYTDFYTAVNVNDNVWRHIVWTINTNGVWKLYMNGNNVYTATLVYPNAVQRRFNYIGMSNWPVGPYLNGAIDDFRYYNRVLTSSDVIDIYTTPFKSTIYFSITMYVNFDFNSDFNSFGFILMNGASISGSNKQVGTGSLLLNAANSQYALVSPFTTGTSGMSFSLWFRSANTGNWGRIFDFGNGAWSDNIFMYVHNNYVGWHVLIGSTAYSYEYNAVNVNDNVWRHIVWTINSNGFWSLYMNGNLIYTTTLVYPNAIQRTLNYIGRSNWDGSPWFDPYFNGAIDDFRYYDRVLASSDVTDIFVTPLKSTIYYSTLRLQNNYFSCIDTCASTLAGSNKDSATPEGSSCYYPSSNERMEANTLCSFKQGMTNWPGVVGGLSTTGWGCSNGATAMTFPCGPAGYVYNPPEASRSYSSTCCASTPVYLHSMLDSSTAYGCWAADTLDTNQFMTIDLGSVQYVAGVVTQARCTYLCPGCNQYVSTYAVGYSTNGIDYALVSTAASSQTFYGPQSAPLQASCDLDEKVYQYFMSPIKTRYIRIYPQSWIGHISMRAGVIMRPVGPSIWTGVTCSSRGLISGLSLTSRGLAGTISSSIGNLIGLTSLDLSTNSIFGLIPPQFSSLSKLAQLYLNSNQLDGPAGSFLCVASITGTSNIRLQSNKLSCIETCTATRAGWTSGFFDTVVPVGGGCVNPSSQPSRQPSSQPFSRPSSLPTLQPSMQPSRQPSSQPTMKPTSQPSRDPSRQPSNQPISRPSSQPSTQPTNQPSLQPLMKPSRQPSSQPTIQPTCQPSSQPSHQPSDQPSLQPTRQPVARPSSQPSVQPSMKPSCQPSSQPSCQPSMQPTSHPTRQPSSQPSMRPTRQPSLQPSFQPTSQPSKKPTRQPSVQPSSKPSRQPSLQPTTQPSKQPSSFPSRQPSSQPSPQPSYQPSSHPSSQPTKQPSNQPTNQPSISPSRQPSSYPSTQPTGRPTQQPSKKPSSNPSIQPTIQPSSHPTNQPTQFPTLQPSSQPSQQPSRQPTSYPTIQPSSQPTKQPTRQPSSLPSLQPSSQPSSKPSIQPSRQPTRQPSSNPSNPSSQPSRQPSSQPSSQPSCLPTSQPSYSPLGPSTQPSSQPTCRPSSQPSLQPSIQPSTKPSYQPSILPSSRPTRQPSLQPTSRPTLQPSSQPSLQPSSLPSMQPTEQPSSQPISRPSSCPSRQPSLQPSCQPSANPSQPSSQPTTIPSLQPTLQPSSHPSKVPSCQPSIQPSSHPSSQPYRSPSSQPSKQPTIHPSSQPSQQPTSLPSNQPTMQPSSQPSRMPSSQPSIYPTKQPSAMPSSQPTHQPSRQPTNQPSCQPSTQPTSNPSNPSSQPSIQPSCQPSSVPSEFSNIWTVIVTRFDDFLDPAPLLDQSKSIDFDYYCTNENWNINGPTKDCTLRLAIYYCLFRFPWSSSYSNPSLTRCNIVIPPYSIIRYNKSFAITESRFDEKHKIRISFIFQHSSVYVITSYLLFDFGIQKRDIVSLTFENAIFKRDLSNTLTSKDSSTRSSISSGSSSTTNSTTTSSHAAAVFSLFNLYSLDFIDVSLEDITLTLQTANKVSISNTLISNIRNHKPRDAYWYAMDIRDVSYLHINSTSFKSNAAGALLVDNCLVLTVRHCHFSNNTAAFGSAMYLSKIRSSIIASNSFIANIAKQAGTVYWLYNTKSMTPPNVTSDNKWIDNIARYYGNKTASSFCGNSCLRFSPDAIQVTDYSNISLPSLITVDVIDYYGSIISYYNGNRVTLSANQELSDCRGLFGNNLIRHEAAVIDKANNLNYMSFYLKNGSTVFSNVGVSCLPSGYMSLEFAVSLSAPHDVFMYRVDAYSNNLPIAFRNCIKGEIFDLVSVTQSTCSKCINSYSFNDNGNFDSVSTSCNPCPVEALKCEGNQIYLKPGTWRPNADTMVIYTCQSLYACIGGNTSGASGCNVGYTGPICGICEKNYYLSDSKQCEYCSVQVQPILQSFGYLLLLFLCIAAFAKILKDKLRIDIKEYLHDDFFTSIVSSVISSYQIILLGMGSTSAFKSLASFSKLASFFRIITINLASMLSLQCFFEYNYYSSLRFTLLFPFSVCALLILFALPSRSAGARNKYYTILINVLCFFIPISSSASFQFFECTSLGGSELYLVSDLSIKCSGALYEYYKIWAVAGVLVYTTWIPLIFLFLLYNRRQLIARKVMIDNYRSVLSHPEFAHMKFSLYYELLPPLDGLYLRSKAEYWWFNTFNIIVSIFLTSVVTILFEDDNIQLLVSIVVLLLSYRIQIHRHPYIYDLDNRFSIWSTFQLAFLYVSLYVRVSLGLGFDGKKYATLDMLMVSLNLFIFLMAIYYLYKHFKDKELKKKSKEAENVAHKSSMKDKSRNNDDADDEIRLAMEKEDVNDEDNAELYKPIGVELDYMSLDDLRCVGTRELLIVMGVLYLRLAPRGTYTNLKKKYRDVGSIVDSFHATHTLPSLYFTSCDMHDDCEYDDEFSDVDVNDKRSKVFRAVTVFSQSRRPDEKMAHLICRGAVGEGVGGSLPFSVLLNFGRYMSIKCRAFTAANMNNNNIKMNLQNGGTFDQRLSLASSSTGEDTKLQEPLYKSIMDDLMRDLESQPTVQALLGGMSEEEFYSHCEGEFLKYDMLNKPNQNIAISGSSIRSITWSSGDIQDCTKVNAAIDNTAIVSHDAINADESRIIFVLDKNRRNKHIIAQNDLDEELKQEVGEEDREEDYDENALYNPYLGDDDKGVIDIYDIVADDDVPAATYNQSTDVAEGDTNVDDNGDVCDQYVDWIIDEEKEDVGIYDLVDDGDATVNMSKSILIAHAFEDNNIDLALSTCSMDQNSKVSTDSCTNAPFISTVSTSATTTISPPAATVPPRLSADSTTAANESSSSIQSTIESYKVSTEINQMCLVCYDKLADYVIIPCGHMCCCSACLLDLKQMKKPCPICRRPIDNMLKVFASGVADHELRATRDNRGQQMTIGLNNSNNNKNKNSNSNNDDVEYNISSNTYNNPSASSDAIAIATSSGCIDLDVPVESNSSVEINSSNYDTRMNSTQIIDVEGTSTRLLPPATAIATTLAIASTTNTTSTASTDITPSSTASTDTDLVMVAANGQNPAALKSLVDNDKDDDDDDDDDDENSDDNDPENNENNEKNDNIDGDDDDDNDDGHDIDDDDDDA